MKAIRHSIVSFMGLYRVKGEASFLPEFYSQCTKVLFRASEELLKFLDRLDNVRMLEVAVRGLAFFFSEPVGEAQARKIGGSNDVEQLAKTIFRYLFLNNRVFQAKVFASRRELCPELVREAVASEASSTSEVSEEDEEGGCNPANALEQGYLKLRHGAAGLLAAMARAFPACFERAWDTLFKPSTGKSALLELLLQVDPRGSQRLACSPQLGKDLAAQFSEPSVFSALLFEPSRKVKAALAVLLQLAMGLRQHKGVLVGLDGQFEDKLQAASDKKKSFMSRS
jgi:hypothetical protein